MRILPIASAHHTVVYTLPSTSPSVYTAKCSEFLTDCDLPLKKSCERKNEDFCLSRRFKLHHSTPQCTAAHQMNLTSLYRLIYKGMYCHMQYTITQYAFTHIAIVQYREPCSAAGNLYCSLRPYTHCCYTVLYCTILIDST